MLIIIHRGTHEIGGTCIEIATQTTRILIDAGSPLEDDGLKGDKAAIPTTLLSSLRKKTPPIFAILISHPHQDHFGMISKLPEQPTVYAGRFASVLMKLTHDVIGKTNGVLLPWKQPKPFSDRKIFRIGDIAVTPYLMDHSGFDSYAILVEAGGKRIFYSGDFRGHGRKAATFDRFLKSAPKDIDVLMLEGTTVGNERDSTQTESELEAELVSAINRTAGPVFTTLSGQNIDRIVTAYRAAKRTKRLFVIDPYIAEVLDRLKRQYTAAGRNCPLPHASWRDIKVNYPQRLCRWLERNGREDIVRRNLPYGVNWRYLSVNQSEIVMVVRPSSPDEIVNKDYFDLSQARWIYSMWKGYLKTDSKLASFSAELKDKGTSIDYLHTSGHADVKALRSMYSALKPAIVIPVHTSHPDKYHELFPNVTELNDGVPFYL